MSSEQQDREKATLKRWTALLVILLLMLVAIFAMVTWAMAQFSNFQLD
ncbi:MAG TPA: hypothetical protein VGL56_09325 [Fimbriimonadaceae bacterium]|jgi:uncharacterized integral membrane protein